jgi:glycosyltransferase involved in cell wall biosynthesis
MRAAICDFPSRYAFPPHGYGGIERWLWAVAIGAKRAGADVHLLGSQWRKDLGDGLPIHPVRLEELSPGSPEAAKLAAQHYDLMVVGHEYPSLPAWRAVWRELGADVATVQHSSTFGHTVGTFDGRRSRLYCYSPEMLERYRDHKPTAELAVHLGLPEDEPPAVQGRDLLWLGRVDAEKAPHLAIQAAARLRRRIRIVGPVFDEAYVAKHGALFGADHVEILGERDGQAKTRLLGQAGVLVYTCARDYVEAGAGVFGEALRAGTPVAALVWRSGTCADAALCPETGAIATADPAGGDNDAVAHLADAITTAERRRAADVQAVGIRRFDPERHFRALTALS